MAVIQNKITGQVYSVSDKEASAIVRNPHMKDCFKITMAAVPEEVKAMKKEEKQKPTRKRKTKANL